jgi:hypothetical protein
VSLVTVAPHKGHSQTGGNPFSRGREGPLLSSWGHLTVGFSTFALPRFRWFLTIETSDYHPGESKSSCQIAPRRARRQGA